MTVFRVKVDYVRGKWLKNHPYPVVEVLASNAKEAAELVCGMALRDKGRACEYRAQVWPLGGVRQAHEIAHFYSA
jgi:phosphoglycerate dehydrogenase-like enzyme